VKVVKVVKNRRIKTQIATEIDGDHNANQIGYPYVHAQRNVKKGRAQGEELRDT